MGAVYLRLYARKQPKTFLAVTLYPVLYDVRPLYGMCPGAKLGNTLTRAAKTVILHHILTLSCSVNHNNA